MSCNKYRHQIPEIIRRKTSYPERLDVLKHIGTCPACRTAYVEYLKILYALDLDVLDFPDMHLNILPLSDLPPEHVKSRIKPHRLLITAASLLLCFCLLIFRGDKPHPVDFAGPGVSAKKNPPALADLEHLLVQLDAGQTTLRVTVLLEYLNRLQSYGIQTIDANMIQRLLPTSERPSTSLDLKEAIYELSNYGQKYQVISKLSY